MTPQTIGIILGGLIPAFLFAFGNVLLKSANDEGIGLGLFILSAALGSFLVGLVAFLFIPDKLFSLRAGLHAAGAGFFWSLGMIFVSIALVKYVIPNSVLVPLYNMNTLIAVLLSLWIFAEWQQVKVPQLLIGSILVLLGGVLVARA